MGHYSYFPLELGKDDVTTLDLFALTGIPSRGAIILIDVPLRLTPEGIEILWSGPQRSVAREIASLVVF